MALSSERNLILALNAGSSSLKISVFQKVKDFVGNPSSSSPSHKEPVLLLLTASIENISAPPAEFSFKATSTDISTESRKDEKCEDIKDHESAFQHFLAFLQEHTTFDKSQIARICHRVVHGGDYPTPVRISTESYSRIESLSDLAPLHNANSLMVIKICIKILPESESIAFFDSMFHSTLPDYVSTYALDQSIAGPKGLRKYGFHGLSYSFILRSVARHLQKPIAKTTLIVMHLGSGASMCAIKDGKSLDTSMGLTPLDGLPGATRSGHVDPSLIFHYTSDVSRISRSATEAMHISLAEEILHKQSGWAALTGTTNFATIVEQSSSSPSHALAFNLFVDRVLHYLGGYFVKLGGAQCIDAIVFSGGIGERSAPLRKAVVDGCKCIGFGIDEGKNEGAGKVEGQVVEIGESGADGKVLKTLVCRTDEQLEMARLCVLDYDNIQ